MRIASRWGGVVAALGLIAAASGTARAGATLTLDPSAASNVVGNGSTSAPGFETGSWQAPGAGGKSEFYISSSALFGRDVSIGEIASISYWTNKGTTAQDPDWTFLIYTEKQTGDASFYHSRLNSEPYLTGTTGVAANTWHEWSTNDPSNPMRFYDANRDGGVFGTYTDPTLADLKAGSVTWPTSGTSADYSGEKVNLFSLQTGSSWANGFTGLVDGLTITLTDNEVATVNLEAVATPEPSTMISVGMAGLIGLGVAWRRRKARVAA